MNIATLSPRTARLFRRYVSRLPFELHPDTPFFHTRGGAPRPHTVDKLGKDFAKVRAIEFPGDRRQVTDFRRSGGIEGCAAPPCG